MIDYEQEKDLFTQSYLGSGAVVCTMCDFITNQSNKQNKKKNIKPVFRGQIGVVNFAIMNVDEESEKKLKELKKKILQAANYRL